MINLTREQLTILIKKEIDEGLEYDDIIKTTDDLHDFCLNIKIGNMTIGEYDYFYYQMVNIIPMILDDIIEYIDELVDYHNILEEQRRDYYRMIAF